MDTMKILLGATIALLIGALALSLQGMKEGVRNTSPDEIARLKQQVDELRIDKERLQLEREIQLLRNAAPQPAAAVPANTPEMDAMRAELAAAELALREIELEKAKAERDAEVFRDEAGEIGRRELEKADNNLRRSRLIKDALLMGRVMEYSEDAEFGDFVTVDVLMPENIRPGTILAIRRNTGILGQLRVADVSPEGAIANIMPGFGPIKPQAGDELILPPP
jgi:hypothetical protein